MTATSFGTTPALSRRLPFDPVRSFAPVVQIAASELTLVVHPQLPVKSLPEFIRLAQRRPGHVPHDASGIDVLQVRRGRDDALEQGQQRCRHLQRAGAPEFKALRAKGAGF